MTTIKMDCPPRGAAVQGKESKAMEAALAKLAPDEAILVTTAGQREMAYKLADKLRITIITRKLQGKGWGVWRAEILEGAKMKPLRV